MSNKSSSWDDDWLFYGPVIAFTIIGTVSGWFIGCDKNSNNLFLAIWILGGGVVGFILGAMAGGFLDSLFESDEKKLADEHTENWEEFADKLKEIFNESNDSYYKILESNKDDSFEIIKNNYRRIVRQYHPDHLGPNASEAIQKYANEMSQKVNDAYEAIKKLRGIK